MTGTSRQEVDGSVDFYSQTKGGWHMFRKFFISCLLILTVGSVVAPSGARAGCGTVDSNLRLVLPCIQFAGSTYSASFRFYANPLDPAGIYWLLESVSGGAPSGAISDSNCAAVDQNLNINAPCVYFMGRNYGISLEYYNNPHDPAHAYWRLGSGLNISPVTISRVTAGDMACFNFDMNQLMNLSQCVTSCAGDVRCLQDCMGQAGIPFGFTVALQLENPGPANIVYTVPAGIFFTPLAGDVQPMLVIEEQEIDVPPGGGTFCIDTYCMDSGLDAPGGETYSQPDVTSSQCLAEIMNAVRGKTLSFAGTTAVQGAVWDCMDTGALTEEDRAALSSL